MSERWTNTANDKGELSEMLIQSLIETAVEQLRFSYTPYSHFKVGAALLASDGTIYTGCNIENAAYTPTNCAERTAFFKAVSEGVRDFRAICIVGGMNGVLSGYTAPCGVCRQVMMEFCDPETFQIILAAADGKYKIYRLKELLPEGLALIILLFPAVFEVNKMVNSIEDVFEVVFRCYFYVAGQ